MLVLTATFLVLPNCSAPYPFRQELDQLASAINTDFTAIRSANDSLIGTFDARYASLADLDLDPAVLATPAGGSFRSYLANQFYYKSLREGACYYYSPGKAPDPAVLRELRIISYLEPAVAATHAANRDIIATIFFGLDQPADIAMMYPWIDVVSIFPPGIKLGAFEWFKRGIGSNGPSVWSKEPFVDLFSGWVMDVAGPVQRSDSQKGVTLISVSMSKLVEKRLARNPGRFLLLSADGAVVGLSPAAKDLLGVAGLSADLLRKTQENTFVKGEQLLGASTNPPFARELAARLLTGASDFELLRDGKAWHFGASAVPEVGFRLIGISEG